MGKLVMNIFDHGTWSKYDPAVYPVDLPLGVIFCRSDIDGVDWYRYQMVGELSHESVKAVCRNEDGKWIVKIAAVEGSKLFPEGGRIIEIYDGDLENPQTTYEGMEYEPLANVLLPPPPPPVIIPTEASKLGLRRVFVERGIWDQVKAMIASDPDMQEEWDLAITIKRTDPLVHTMIAALNLQPADVDAIMIRQRELV
jgi:hypothetical protein